MLKKNNVNNEEYTVTNFTDINNPILGLYWESDTLLDIPKGSCFDVKMRMERLEDNITNQEIRIMNRLEFRSRESEISLSTQAIARRGSPAERYSSTTPRPQRFRHSTHPLQLQ